MQFGFIRKRGKPFWTLLSLLAIVVVGAAWFVVFRAYQSTSASAQLMQRRLQEELTAIEPPASVHRVQHNEISKIGHGNISEYFQTDLSYGEIRGYYDGELVKHGWKFQKETKLTSWGEDHGELMAFYCKESVSAELYYTGQEETNLKYRYSFGLSWGIYQCK